METKIFISMTIDELKEIIVKSVTDALILQQNLIKPEEDESLISLADVAKMFSVSKVTIHKWKKDGQIPFYRLSRRVYFKKNEVVKALKEARNGYKYRKV